MKFKFKSGSTIGSYQSHKQYKHPLYSQSEQESMEYEGIARNPVIVIHGFLGAKLINKDSEKFVWGDFKEVDMIRGFSESKMHELAHPMEYQKPISELKDNLVASDMLTKYSIRVLGVHIEREAYQKMITILEQAGYVDESQPMPEDKNINTLFKFFYDWRKDISENAVKLHDFILSKRKYLQRKYKELYGVEDFDVQFDIVAHSKGGLIARYFLRYGDQVLPDDGSQPKLNWVGKKYTDKVIMIGTPNGGYLDSLIELVDGLKIINYGPLLPPAVIGTFPSYYQMMPMPGARCFSYNNKEDTFVDIFDFKVWIKLKWGLANPAQREYLDFILPDIKSKHRRRETALEHLKKCLEKAKQFYEAMSVYDTSANNLTSSYLFVGNAVPTSRKAEVDKKTGDIKITRMEAGDGKVLVSSALMDERDVFGWEPFLISSIKWESVIQIEAAHMGITESSSFEDNILYYLLMAPSKKFLNRKEYIYEMISKIKAK